MTKTASRFCSNRHRHVSFVFRWQRSGVALVVTLAFLVLITVAVLAFFTRTTNLRAIESVRSNRVVTMDLARTASDYILSEFSREAADPENSLTIGSRFLRPVDRQTIVPARRLNDPSLATVADFDLLWLQSRGVTTTDVPAAGGRSITPESWNLPQLIGGNGFDASSQLPQWLYLSTNGTISTEGNQETVGRFAYNIYRTGTLLDLNHAGGALDRASKRSPLAADFDSVIPAGPMSGSAWRDWRSPGANDLQIEKSRMSSAGLQEAGTGRQLSGRFDLLNALRQTRTGIGSQNPGLVARYFTHFLREANTPSLPFADASEIGFNNPDHFSVFYQSAGRFLAYSDEGRPYEYEIRAGDPVLHRRFSLGKLGRIVDGENVYWLTPIGPGSGITPAAIRDVFGLVWDAPNERWIYVGAGTTGNSPATEIKTLEEVAAAGRPPDFFEILKAGMNPNSLGGSQTLNGGIEIDGDNPPVLGGNNERREWLRQQSFDLHVLRIGACMIDQADDDNLPTRIAFDPQSNGEIEVAGIEDLPYLQAFLLANEFVRIRNPDPGDPDQSSSWYFDKVQIFGIPFVFNPHRKNNNGPRTPAINVRILDGRVSDLHAYSQAGPIEEWWKNVHYPGQLIDMPLEKSGMSLNLPLDDYRQAPRTISGNGGSVDGRFDILRFDSEAVGWNQPGVVPSLPGIQGSGQPILIPMSSNAIPNVANKTSRIRNRFNQRPSIKLDQFLLALTFESPDGKERVYDTLGGAVPDWTVDLGWLVCGPQLGANPAPASQNVNAISNQTRNPYKGEPPNARRILNLGGSLLLKLDPRTSRYGLFGSVVEVSATKNFLNVNEHTGIMALRADPDPTTNYHNVYLIPPRVDRLFSGPSWLPPGAQSVAPGDWWGHSPVMRVDMAALPAGGTDALAQSGTLASSTLGNIPDRPQDTNPVYRPNVGYFGPGANPLAGSQPASQDAPSRPMILQRPFKNIAELGHVFRDQPWKAVGFFHDTSPDLALLDLFSLHDSDLAVLGGRSDLNAISTITAKAVLRGTGIALNPEGDAYSSTLADADADALAEQIHILFENSQNASTGISDAARQLLSSPSVMNEMNKQGPIKTSREAVLGAIFSLTQARNANYLADMIIQSGRFPAQSASFQPSRFIVQGETRLFFSFSFDRFTGRPTATEMEPANE